MIYLLFRPIVWPFLWLYWRPVFRGIKHLRRVKGPAIFISNHVSAADPVIIALASVRIVYFMAKVELFKKKLAAFFLRGLNVYPVNRTAADLSSVKKTLALLKRGKVVGIFAEGQRSKTRELLPFEQGAAMLALRSNTPVYPICVAHRKWGRKYVAAGERVDLSDLDGMAKSAALEEATRRFHLAVAALMPEA